MGKLFKSHLRKGRTGLIVVVIFITLAVFLMTVGLSILSKANKFYPDKIEELGSSEAMVFGAFPLLYGDEFDDLFYQKLATLDYIEKYDKRSEIVLTDGIILAYPNGNTFDYSKAYNMEEETSFPIKITSSVHKEGMFPIYLSSLYEIKEKFVLGSPITIDVYGEKKQAYVAGFYEQLILLYGSSLFFTDNEHMALLESWVKKPEIPSPRDGKSYTYEVKFDSYNFETINKFRTDVSRLGSECLTSFLAAHPELNQLPEPIDIFLEINTLENVIPSSEPFILLIALILIIFSFIITFVALLILRFLIKSGIEDDIKNIGINKGLGYTTKQLQLSYLAIYGILLFVGCVIGIVVALCMAPVFGKIITLLANVHMTVPPNFIAAILSLVLTIGIALVSIYFATKKLQKVTPLHAIRNIGIATSTVNKGLPLEKCKLDVNSALSLKSIIANKSQSIMIFIICLVMTFLCAFSSVCYYNMNINKDVMLKLGGREVFDVGIYIVDKSVTNADADRIFEKLSASPLLDEMNKAFIRDNNYMLDGNYYMDAYVAEDYAKVRTNSVYEGRYPLETNEVSLPGTVANNLNKKIGDSVTITKGKNTVTCTIVGLTQSLYLKNTLNLRLSTFSELATFDTSFFSYNERAVYLKDKADIDKYIAWANEILIDEKVEVDVYNNRQYVESSIFDMVSPASTLMMTIILIITAFVVATVVFMIIRIKMIRERKNIAINKALGFTSFNIMSQISLSILFIVAPAVILGGILGGVLSPLIISVLGKAIGLMKLSFHTSFGLIAAVGIVIIAITYIISSVTALSTKFITPRMLVGK